MSFKKLISQFKSKPKSPELLLALATHPADPLKVFAELLAVSTTNTNLLLEFVQRRRCGLEKKTKKGAYITYNATSAIVTDAIFHIHQARYSMVGSTPLILAAFADRADVVGGLLALGADARASTDSNVTALHLAAWRGNTSAIEALVNFGAKINEQLVSQKKNFFAFSPVQESPLHLAATMNHVPAMEVLLSRGASTEVSTHNAFTPIMSAILAKAEEAVALLAERGARCDQIYFAIYNVKGQTTIFDTLLSHGCPVDRIQGRYVPLHIAFTVSNETAMRALIDFGANAQFPDPFLNGMYPLAKMHGVIQMLLDAGAETSALRPTDNDVVDALLKAEGALFV